MSFLGVSSPSIHFEIFVCKFSVVQGFSLKDFLSFALFSDFHCFARGLEGLDQLVSTLVVIVFLVLLTSSIILLYIEL